MSRSDLRTAVRSAFCSYGKRMTYQAMSPSTQMISAVVFVMPTITCARLFQKATSAATLDDFCPGVKFTGVLALHLRPSAVLRSGTKSPGSVGHYVTYGRTSQTYNVDVVNLYDRISAGTERDCSQWPASIRIVSMKVARLALGTI